MTDTTAGDPRVARVGHRFRRFRRVLGRERRLRRGVFARRFAASGAPLGSQFQVNSYTTGTQSGDLAMNAVGDLAFGWIGAPTSPAAGSADAGSPPRRAARQRVHRQRVHHRDARPRAHRVRRGRATSSWPGRTPCATGRPTASSRGASGGCAPPRWPWTHRQRRPPAQRVGGRRAVVAEPQRRRPDLRREPGVHRPRGPDLFAPRRRGQLRHGGGRRLRLLHRLYAVSIASRRGRRCTGTPPRPRPSPPTRQGQRKAWSVHVGRRLRRRPGREPVLSLHRDPAPFRRDQRLRRLVVLPGQPHHPRADGRVRARRREGAVYAPPACGTPVFADVPASSGFCRWIEELARRSVAGGCGGGDACPGAPVTREQMAVFVLRTLDPGLNPPACAPPNLYNDVPETSGFCRWIEELTVRGVVSSSAGAAIARWCPSPASRWGSSWA